jgi:hypothetical protein
LEENVEPEVERAHQEFMVQIEGIALSPEQVKQIDTAVRAAVLKELVVMDVPVFNVENLIPEEIVGVKVIAP